MWRRKNHVINHLCWFKTGNELTLDCGVTFSLPRRYRTENCADSGSSAFLQTFSLDMCDGLRLVLAVSEIKACLYVVFFFLPHKTYFSSIVRIEFKITYYISHNTVSNVKKNKIKNSCGFALTNVI